MPPPGVRSLRDYVVSLATALPVEGGPPSDALAACLREAPVLVVVDPVFLSEYRDRPFQERAGPVFVVDGAFVLAAAAAMGLRRPVRAWRQATRLARREGRSEAFATVARTVLDRLLSPVRQTEAIFFTSNSTLTEVLRSHALQDARCTRLVEVMHGVGSVPAAKYFDRVLQRAPPERAARHLFVPQIPDIPAEGVLSRRLRDNTGRSVVVNAYLNNYAIRRGLASADLARFVKGELGAFAPEAVEDGARLIVTVFGNFSNIGRGQESPSFEGECLLLQLAAERCRASGRPFVLVYVPHPLNRDMSIDHPVFRENDVRVCRDSTFTWLVSDVAIALLSSALFEAAFFGARAFTPSLPEDGFYSSSYLDIVARPRSDSLEALKGALDEVVVKAASEPAVPPVEKAQRRLERTGWRWTA